ncbi:MAG: lysophospholipase [Akkermansiaceae bacterium]|nr:lysophospholipase [Akkermansiaceae bacterium]MCF7733146.1 lysophospholipase [Akkermansiaceae bacterium]
MSPAPTSRSFFHRHWRRLTLLTALATTLTVCGIVLWSGWKLASPTRRPLQDYHREYLAHSAAHGLKIEPFTTADGTPCLACTPDPTGHLGERGTKIRNQLATRGFALRSPGQIVGTLVLLHGRNGRKEDYLPIAERFCAAGFRCLIPDLPAHGEHPTATTTYGVREAGLPARVLAEASLKFAFDPQPAGLMGMSMGGSVAVHAAALPDAPWRALVVISSFDSLPAVMTGQATRRAGRLLGPPWAAAAAAVFRLRTGLSVDAIRPDRQAAAIRIPTFIAHGTADSIVPHDSGRSLFDSLPPATTKQWTEVPGADHHNVFITDFPIYADTAAWLLTHLAAL